MKVAELREMAREAGVPNAAKHKKAELVEKILKLAPLLEAKDKKKAPAKKAAPKKAAEEAAAAAPEEKDDAKKAEAAAEEKPAKRSRAKKADAEKTEAEETPARRGRTAKAAAEESGDAEEKPSKMYFRRYLKCAKAAPRLGEPPIWFWLIWFRCARGSWRLYRTDHEGNRASLCGRRRDAGPRCGRCAGCGTGRYAQRRCRRTYDGR